ncbi:MAG: hypothetical protein WCH76_08140 [Candidatus Riflemargulisbacteria bacterium]
MSILTQEMKNDLVWAMRAYLTEACNNNKFVTESDQQIQKKFIKEEATYEQLMNLCFNKSSKDRYMDSEVLESFAAINFANFVEESKVENKNRSVSLFESTAELVQEAQYIKKGAAAVKSGAKAAASKIGAGAKVGYEKSKKAAAKVIEEIKAAGIKAKDKLSNLSKKQKTTAGVVIISAAIVSTLAYLLYKRYFSAAAQACKGKAGEEFKKCVKEYKLKAIEQTIETLRSKKSSCSKAANPEKCTAAVEKEIKRWEAKKAKISK